MEGRGELLRRFGTSRAPGTAGTRTRTCPVTSRTVTQGRLSSNWLVFGSLTLFNFVCFVLGLWYLLSLAMFGWPFRF